MTEPVRPLEALIDQWRERVEKNRDRGSREHLALADGYDICADELEAALLQAAAPPAPTAERYRFDQVLQIAGLVNAYHNDGTTLTAAEMLKAIAEVLGPAMGMSAPPERVSEGKE